MMDIMMTLAPLNGTEIAVIDDLTDVDIRLVFVRR